MYDELVESHRRLDNAHLVAASRQQLRDQQQVGEQETAHVRLRTEPHETVHAIDIE